MHKIKTALCLLMTAVILFTVSACGKAEEKTDTLKIGVNDISGIFNPFYAEAEADKVISAQFYPAIQRKGTDNRLINEAGNITYEYGEGTKIKYTVTIRNDIFFSDGTNATIDDVIFWYYLLADATYDGPYSNFYLNDIEGLKEYYYDDTDYESKISAYGDNEELINNYITSNYADGVDVTEISGIKRIDDYTCTIMFNSKNINAVSEINASVVSKAFYSKNYVKGSADKVREIDSTVLGCGPYCLSEYEKDGNTVKLESNKYYYNDAPSFSTVLFTDLAGSGKTETEAVTDGDVDLVYANISTSDISSLSKTEFKYSAVNDDRYYSLFFSTSITEEARKIMMSICDVYDVVDSEYGSYYTRVYLPLSIRFEEYPTDAKAYYSDNTVLTAELLQSYVPELDAYCVGDSSSLGYGILSEFAEELGNYGVTLNITSCSTRDELSQFVKSGEADIWLDYTPDGTTCDKYDYYHSDGKYNTTGLNDSTVDELIESYRNTTGFIDNSVLCTDLLETLMEKAVELPLYQLQKAYIYNPDVINPESFDNLSQYDGFSYFITVFN